MCVGPWAPPKPPVLPPVPATPPPDAVFGQRITLNADQTSTVQGAAPTARSASSLMVPRF